jgi:tRNA 5-methylaminomethyl-2-thiouridine biosynthesis bifunctional protein
MRAGGAKSTSLQWLYFIIIRSMSGAALIPASLSFVEGVPYAEAFGDVYHSVDGGLAQARHVFLGGNRLPERWARRERFAILETGFGLGLNFLATWTSWRDDPARPQQLHYVAIEKHPFSAADLAQLHALWPELRELSQSLCAAWPPLVPGFHRLLLDHGRVVLTLIFGDIADCLPEIDAGADAFYLDGFSPGKNPDMWAPGLLERLNRLAAPDATLATYTVSGAVRRALTQGGFVCEKQPGFGRKREMLAARFAPRWQPPPRRAVCAAVADRQALVIGAGLAGSAACERLAVRGWQVTLIERHERPAQEASGNLAGIAMPLISKDDNLMSRLARAAYLFSLGLWRHIGGIGHAFSGEACGVLQLASDALHAQTQRETAQRWHYPSEYAQWLDGPAAAQLIGGAASHGGWLFPQGGWVHPASLCRALLDACGAQLQTRYAHSAVRLERQGEQWQAKDERGVLIAEAPVAIFAVGADAGLLAQTKDLPLAAVRGQVTHIPAASLPALPVVVCGEGYLTRPAQGLCSMGASYDFDDDPSLRRDSHQENLMRLAQILPHAIAGLDGLPVAGRVGFRCVSPDRLPLVGALPDHEAAGRMSGSRLADVPRLPKAYTLLGYGSRGLIWAPFAAEFLAACLNGEPLPVEKELAAALDPARFVLKERRRGR